MKALKIIAVLLVAAGLVVLVYGGFNYPKSNHEAKLGSLEFAVKDEGHTRHTALGRGGRDHPRHAAIAGAGEETLRRG